MTEPIKVSRAQWVSREEWDAAKEPHPSDCGCGPAWQQPKSNDTCATCGGWLPGERPSLWLRAQTEENQ